MRILWRILMGLAVSAVLVVVLVYWVFPTGISIWTMRTAPKRARVVPVELKDFSVSQEPGSKINLFGYEFEVPWSE